MVVIAGGCKGYSVKKNYNEVHRRGGFFDALNYSLCVEMYVGISILQCSLAGAPPLFHPSRHFFTTKSIP